MVTINRERRERREEAEKNRLRKIERSKELSKRLELLRLCVEFIKEHGGEWERRKSDVEKKRNEEESNAE